MSNKDEFELDVEETAEDEFDDASLEGVEEESEAAPAKKKSGGGLTVFAVLLLLLGGGGFAAVKFLGVQLPFDIPGLTQTAQTQPVQTDAPQMAVSADLPAGDLPPQPEVAALGQTQTGALPLSIEASEATADVPAGATDPWGFAVDTQDAQESATAVDPFAPTGETAETSSAADPFAFDAQEVTAEVVAKGEEALDAAKEVVKDAALEAEKTVENVAEAVKEEIKDPFVALVEPHTDPAAVETPAGSASVATSPAETAPVVTETPVATEAEVKTPVAETPVVEKSVETVKAVEAKPVEEPKAVKVEEKKEAEPKKPAEAAAETAKPKEAAKPAAPVRKVEWVLRSARPGSALVSERGSNEMRTVAVGDTLAGIGKVTSIAADSQGRWVVNGTRGSIKQ